ncbi:MAG: hypothetical protein KTR35_03445 [Gammaproteobacteria bacterium]|nr:hypothetical protein [Gammaproteobacteria bacterium]
MSKQNSPLTLAPRGNKQDFSTSFIDLGDPDKGLAKTETDAANHEIKESDQPGRQHSGLFVDLDSMSCEESTPEMRYWSNELAKFQTRRRRRSWRRVKSLPSKASMWFVGIAVLLVGSSSLAMSERFEKKNILSIAASYFKFGLSEKVSTSELELEQKFSVAAIHKSTMVTEPAPDPGIKVEPSVNGINAGDVAERLIKSRQPKSAQLITDGETSGSGPVRNDERLWHNPQTGLSVAVDPRWKVTHDTTGVQLLSLFQLTSDLNNRSNVTVSISHEKMNGLSVADKMSEYLSGREHNVVFGTPVRSIETTAPLALSIIGHSRGSTAGEIRATLLQTDETLWVLESRINKKHDADVDALDRLRLSLLATIQ